MSDHRHATDRKRVTVVAGCPNGCQQYELETEGKAESVESLIEDVTDSFGECTKCGASMGVLRDEEPSEVLE
ncbi:MULTISPECIES: hypothetical protein [Natrinema]|uniref:Uncharacterized protein n=2 Tax=Natrinema TaxID=88723 RepID=L9YI95_9EURY|nr:MULTISPECIES: hypothetical protein [Natrinema]ELY73232.1 hypothetical protein C487_17560 [Natrinema pallidum DSM 3751]ELY85269.1 hypothetical protein C486_00215 [Natrinema gari JCM 14663]